MEYYLIDEEEISLTIVRKSALVIEEFDLITLEKGLKVKFMYPELSEAELVEIRKEEVKKFRKAMNVSDEKFIKNFSQYRKFSLDP